MYKLNKSQDLLKYSDSDYVSDKLNRKFILNYVYLLKKESMSWVSQKQKLVIILIIEIEYITILICTKTEV